MERIPLYSPCGLAPLEEKHATNSRSPSVLQGGCSQTCQTFTQTCPSSNPHTLSHPHYSKSRTSSTGADALDGEPILSHIGQVREIRSISGSRCREEKAMERFSSAALSVVPESVFSKSCASNFGAEQRLVFLSCYHCSRQRIPLTLAMKIFD